MIGIYKITNQVNQKSYIGQSKYIEKRWNDHKTGPFDKNDKSYEYLFYRAIRKYGLENFSFDVIEECEIDNLNEREKYWIEYYDSFFNGYNQTLGGDGGSSVLDKEKIIGIIYDLETTKARHKEIAAKWNVSSETVQSINTGRSWLHNRKYPIQQKEPTKTNRNCEKCGNPIHRLAKSNFCSKCFPETARKVERPNRQVLKNEIRNNSFLELGRKYGVSDNAIRKWCVSEKLPSKKTEIKLYSDEEWNKI